MATRKPPRTPDTLPPYHRFDPIPQPDVDEKGSDTAWQLFNEVQAKEQDRYADTVAHTRPGGLKRTKTDSQQPGAPIRPAPSNAGASGMQKLVEETRRNNRVCPVPAKWKEFDAALRLSVSQEVARSLPPALSDRNWNQTTSLAKRLMFRSVVDWCAEHKLVEPALQYVRALSESDWHHMGE